MCKMSAFSPEKPTKRQKFYISGRSRYILFIIYIFMINHLEPVNVLYFGAKKKPPKGGTNSNQNRGHQRVPGIYIQSGQGSFRGQTGKIRLIKVPPKGRT